MQEITAVAAAIGLTAWLKQFLTGSIGQKAQDLILTLFPLLVCVLFYAAPLYFDDTQLSLAATVLTAWFSATGIVKFTNQVSSRVPPSITRTTYETTTQGE